MAPNLRHVLMLFAINLLILMTGAFASYYTHDGDRELERIVHQKARLRRELSRWWRRWSYAAARYDRIVKTARGTHQPLDARVRGAGRRVPVLQHAQARQVPARSSAISCRGGSFLVRSFGPEADPSPWTCARFSSRSRRSCSRKPRRKPRHEVGKVPDRSMLRTVAGASAATRERCGEVLNDRLEYLQAAAAPISAKTYGRVALAFA